MVDRETALQVIEKLNGTVLQGSSGPLHIRFADSAAQKRLKRQALHKRAESSGSGQLMWSPMLMYAASPPIAPVYGEQTQIDGQRSPPPINHFMSGYASPTLNQSYNVSGYATPHYSVGGEYISSGYASPEMTSPYLGSSQQHHQQQHGNGHQFVESHSSQPPLANNVGKAGYHHHSYPQHQQQHQQQKSNRRCDSPSSSHHEQQEQQKQEQQPQAQTA
ncbi:hypothetical protein EV182_003187, partial [Spiromyces aspiralis]